MWRGRARAVELPQHRFLVDSSKNDLFGTVLYHLVTQLAHRTLCYMYRIVDAKIVRASTPASCLSCLVCLCCLQCAPLDQTLVRTGGQMF